MPDEQLRARVDEHFRKLLTDDMKDDEVREAASATIQAYPELLDYYIREKEENGEKAHQVSDLSHHTEDRSHGFDLLLYARQESRLGLPRNSGGPVGRWPVRVCQSDPSPPLLADNGPAFSPPLIPEAP